MSILHHERIAAPSAQPARWALVLHGVFGSGANWRSLVRRLAAERPEWGFVLVDLRGHGRTPRLDPPHDLDAMAEDLRRLVESLGDPVEAVLGHSLGGKVALAYGASGPPSLRQLWVLDSQPGARGGGEDAPSRRVLRLLEGLPESFADRESFIRAVEEAGQGRDVAAWLAMSLARGEDGRYRSTLDLGAIRSILDDYFRRDLWVELARGEPRRKLHLVVAGRSFVWQPDDLARLERLAEQSPDLEVHRIEEAGHWLHVDAAERLTELLVTEL